MTGGGASILFVGSIIARVRKKYWRQTHNFRVKMPKSVEEALQFDQENWNHLWREAIKKEMSKAKVSYQVKEGMSPRDVQHGTVSELLGYTKIGCHIVFDVKMDFTNETGASASMTYSSVVSRNSVQLAFLIAGLNNLNVMVADLKNVYLNALCAKKIWFVGDLNVGKVKGKCVFW